MVTTATSGTTMINAICHPSKLLDSDSAIGSTDKTRKANSKMPHYG